MVIWATAFTEVVRTVFILSQLHVFLVWVTVAEDGNAFEDFKVMACDVMMSNLPPRARQGGELDK